MILVAISACTAAQDLGERPGADEPDGGPPVGNPPDTNDSGAGDSGAVDSGRPPGDRDASEDTEKDAGSDAAEDLPFVPNAKRVFETSGLFNGNLKAEGAGATGPEGADNLCAGAALAGGLGGAWRAWVSAAGANAADRIADASPWYLVDRKRKVFDRKIGTGQGALVPQAPGLKVGPLLNIDVNELGVMNSPRNAWTGTTKAGTVSPFNCNGWTNSQPVSGYEGLVGIGISVDITWWTDSSTNPCSGTNRLMCFEQ